MKEEILRKMKEKGLNLPPQRMAIVDTFVEQNPLHPGARLIYQEARKKYRGLSFSTVYLTLNELSKHGIIKMLEFDRMENRFDGNLDEHINLICKGCRKITDHEAPPRPPRPGDRGKGSVSGHRKPVGILWLLLGMHRKTLRPFPVIPGREERKKFLFLIGTIPN